MSRWEAWSLHMGMLALLATGAGFAIAKYLLAADDPFSAVGSPWQPTALALHVLAAPLLVFAVGLVFRRHVLTKYQDRRRDGRRTGTSVLVLMLLTTVTGYALQVTSSELGRRALALSHLGLGAALGAGYLAHVKLRQRPAVTDPNLPLQATPSACARRALRAPRGASKRLDSRRGGFHNPADS